MDSLHATTAELSSQDRDPTPHEAENLLSDSLQKHFDNPWFTLWNKLAIEHPRKL